MGSMQSRDSKQKHLWTHLLWKLLVTGPVCAFTGPPVFFENENKGLWTLICLFRPLEICSQHNNVKP